MFDLVNSIRGHPFNLKGVGAMVFWGQNFSVSKFDGENLSVFDMGRKKEFC